MGKNIVIISKKKKIPRWSTYIKYGRPRKPEYAEKTTDLSQVTDKLYHTDYPEKTTDLSQVTDKLYHTEYPEKTTDLSQVTDKLYQWLTDNKVKYNNT